MPTDDVYPCPHCHGTGEVRPSKGEDMGDINALLDKIREQAARLDPLSRYDLTHDNGCGICRDPNCSDPNGPH